MFCRYIRRSISTYSLEHPGMKGAFQIEQLWFPCLGFTVLWFLHPAMLAHNQDKTGLTYTNSQKGPENIWSTNYSMTKPYALCAGIHTKIDDICFGIFKQWWILYRSNISDGDVIDMHENLYKQFSDQKKKKHRRKGEIKYLLDRLHFKKMKGCLSEAHTDTKYIYFAVSLSADFNNNFI